MKRIVTSAIFIFAILLSACGTQAAPTAQTQTTLTVFAAASLTDAFTLMGKNFEANHPGVKVKFNFAGSQTLRAQLEEGAAADVFASANQTEMDTAVKDGLIAQDSPQIFLTNKLIVVLPSKNPANIQNLQDLVKPNTKIVLAADTVPAGKYALQVLDKLSADSTFGSDYKTKVLTNVVSNENDVKQVVAKVQLDEADAGIVYISDAIAAPDLMSIEIPDNFNVIAKYPIAALSKSANADLAKQFVDYVLSKDGQAALKSWGFTPINP